MTSVVEKARFRLIALNPVNIAGNEVEGTAIGGVEKVVAAEGKKVQIMAAMMVVGIERAWERKVLRRARNYGTVPASGHKKNIRVSEQDLNVEVGRLLPRPS